MPSLTQGSSNVLSSVVSSVAEASGKVEYAPLIRPALHPDLARHHLHQARGDGQAESCSSVFSRRRSIRLCEGFKNELLLLCGNPDARVRDRKVQANILFGLGFFFDF